METELEVVLLMSGFFPRKNKRVENTVDEGDCTRGKCHKCGKLWFVWTSIEFCPYCEYFVDYWEHGDKTILRFFTDYGQDKIVSEFFEAFIKTWLTNQELPHKRVSVEIT